MHLLLSLLSTILLTTPTSPFTQSSPFFHKSTTKPPPPLTLLPMSTTTPNNTPPSPSSRVFLLGVGFTQFLLAQQLSRANIPSVAMTDVSRINAMRENWITTPNCELVTNGEGEWEFAALECTSLVICPEQADIPGTTVQAILKKMPNVQRVVVVNPAGSSGGGMIVREEGSWFDKLIGGKPPKENMAYAKSIEQTIQTALDQNQILDYTIIHRGTLNGGGGDFGLGDPYYKVCGSEPEEVLQRCYDNGRMGTLIYLGDCMDTSPKKTDLSHEEEEELVKLKVMEEIKDKTHRVPLVNSIVSVLKMERPPERMTVVCTLGEVPLSVEEVEKIILEAVPVNV